MFTRRKMIAKTPSDYGKHLRRDIIKFFPKEEGHPLNVLCIHEDKGLHEHHETA